MSDTPTLPQSTSTAPTTGTAPVTTPVSGAADSSSPSQPPQETGKPDLAAAVTERRTSAALAKLMAQKRELDAVAEKVKTAAPVLSAFEEAKRYAELGDHGRAFQRWLEATYGADKSKEALPKIYDSLTSQILGVESAEQLAKRQQAELTRLTQQVEALERSRKEMEAERVQWESENRDRQVDTGIQTISSMLTAQQSQYPYLMAEADDPGRLVWDIMVEAAERGEEVPEWDEAAKIANNHFKPLVENKFNRYKQTLLAQQHASGAPVQPESPPSQSGSQRMSLTNADASQVPPLRTPQPIQNRDDSITQAWKILQERHLNQQ